MQSFYSLVLLAISLTLTQCSPKANPKTSHTSADQYFTILDSIDASKAIIKDKAEQFFEKIQLADMKIQMNDRSSEKNRTIILQKYKNYIAHDVEDFSENEKDYVLITMEQARELVNKISPKLMPLNINLIKTKGKHYGNSVYYTRENCIIIPANVLQNRKKDDFLQTMLHEIFHIISRYDVSLRNQLYKLIGFYPIQERLVLPQITESRLLTNPDGINYRYYIFLKGGRKDKFKAVPLLYTDQLEMKDSKSEFFDYVQFSLFELEQKVNNSFTVLSDNNGFPTISLGDFPDFFTQITDNTNYIIHPDELMADNFSYIALQHQEGGFDKKYSTQGKELLDKIETILKNY